MKSKDGCLSQDDTLWFYASANEKFIATSFFLLYVFDDTGSGGFAALLE
jgi:hypothetical protein